jgi:acetate kinase
MNGLDAVLFTGGIGENAPDVREAVCSDMDVLGIKIDAVANAGVKGKLAKVSQSDSKVEVWVVPTNEELLIARDTLALIS